jgi:hypothetical protein
MRTLKPKQWTQPQEKYREAQDRRNNVPHLQQQDLQAQR